MKFPRLALPWFLALALLLGVLRPPPLPAAEPAPAPPAPPAGVTNLNLQEELRSTQLVLEQMRRELDQNSARTAAAITSSLSMLEPTLSRLQAQQMQLVQRSNSTILVVAGVFAGVGFLALLLIVVILMRALSRFSELAASQSAANRPLLPAGPAPAALGPGDLAHLNAAAVEQASARFQQAMEHLQKRIFELEHATQPAVPEGARALAPGAAAALNISPLPGPAKAAENAETAARIGLLLGKGQALLNLDQAEQALECFEEILTLEPNHTETLIRRGLALEKLQQWEKALECYDRAIALDNSLTVAFLYKGGVCNKLQRHREALDSYEKALHTEKRSRAS